MNEEALAHATMAFNVQLAAVRAENTKLYSKLERGETEIDRVQTEVMSYIVINNNNNNWIYEAPLPENIRHSLLLFEQIQKNCRGMF